MCETRSPSEAGGRNRDDGCEERVGRVQAQLRDSEAKRMELERKMLGGSKSDTYTPDLEYMRLKKYLEEICERQKKSLLRNKDLLKEFDCIASHIKKFASSSESLQKLKVDYEKEIKSRLAHQKNNTFRGDKKDCFKQQMMPEVRQAGMNTRTSMSRGLYHTATIFMGRQMSAVSSVEDFSALQKSSQLTKSFSISDPRLRRQPSQSSCMTDSCVVQTNSDLQHSNKSDKIDEKTYLPMGEEMPVTSSVSYENGRTCCLTAESKTNNCSGNFVESKMSPELNSLLHGRLSSENRTTDFKSDSLCRSVEATLTHEHSVLNEQGSKRPISPVFCSEQLVSGNEHLGEKFPVQEDDLQPDKNIQGEEDECSDGSSDSSISLGEEDEEMNLLKVPGSLSDLSSKMSLKSVNSREVLPKEEHQCSQTICHCTSSGGSSASPATRERLSFEGFCRVLTFIEELVAKDPSECLTLYQSKAVHAADLEALTSLCNQTGSLEQEDLEICEALVLHQLQRLLQNPLNGCLLPEKMFNYKSGTFNEKQTRSELSACFAMTRERLRKHVLLLEKHHTLLGEEAKDMFDMLLISERQEQGVLANNSSMKEDKHAQWLCSNGAKGQEITSWCEDESKEESLVEKIPITGLNIDGCDLKEEKSNGTSSEASFSSRERRSPLSRDNRQTGMIRTTKSKAFWGDSDDSNSEIEAALRPPQGPSSREDEFDDFYD